MLLLLLSYMKIAETWRFPASAQNSPFLTLCETVYLFGRFYRCSDDTLFLCSHQLCIPDLAQRGRKKACAIQTATNQERLKFWGSHGSNRLNFLTSKTWTFSQTSVFIVLSPIYTLVSSMGECNLTYSLWMGVRLLEESVYMDVDVGRVGVWTECGLAKP